MKMVTLLAAIAAIFQVLGSFYYLLLNFEVIEYNRDVNRGMQFLFLLSGISLVVFFFKFYESLTKRL